MTRPWLPRARPLMGKISDHEIARRFGIARSIVSRTRRRLLIPPVRNVKPRGRAWLEEVRSLLGTLSDREIARRTGRDRRMIGEARRALAIGAAPRGLGPASDRPWLGRVRHLLGKMPDREVGKRAGQTADLIGTVRRELGIPRSWRRPTVRGKGRTPLTEALLLSHRSTAEIARMTGMAAGTVGSRRRALGVRRPPPLWHEKARPMLGKRMDSEIARRVGVSAASVQDLRQRMGIQPAPPRSRAAVTRIPPARIRKLRRTLSAPDRVVLEGRCVAIPPRSLAEIGRELGISKQAVADRERRILDRLE